MRPVTFYIILFASILPHNVTSAHTRRPLTRLEDRIVNTPESHALGVKCGLRLVKTTFSIDEPILLKFEVENHSSEVVRLNLGVDREGAFQFDLKQPNDELKQLPRKRARPGLTRTGKFSLAANQRYSQQIILNEWHTFREPGEYVLRLRKTLTVVAPTGAVDCDDSDLVFQLRPTDEITLKETSSLLLGSIASNRSHYGLASEAASALINVNNPIVVPYLEQALEANPAVDAIIIEGLTRIGDHRAIEVLLSILERSDRKMSQFTQARQALVEISNRIPASPDQALIKRALEHYR